MSTKRFKHFRSREEYSVQYLACIEIPIYKKKTWVAAKIKTSERTLLYQRYRTKYTAHYSKIELPNSFIVKNQLKTNK